MLEILPTWSTNIALAIVAHIATIGAAFASFPEVFHLGLWIRCFQLLDAQHASLRLAGQLHSFVWALPNFGC